jgi:hypothetical protein
VNANRLWEVLEDPRASETARAGAVVALGSAVDEETRERLRAVSDATASPKLRVVIAAASNAEDDARLEAALAECDDAMDPRAAKGRS